MSAALQAALEDCARHIDSYLNAALANQNLSPRLAEAMRYAALGDAKRIRPFLVIETAKLFGVNAGATIDIAASLECVHCYSLIHDDLPSMDDDDLRRGRSSLHKAFDEATAILAGDALLTLAFEMLAAKSDAACALRLVTELAQAAGANGMVGGQMLDLAAEGRFGEGVPLSLSQQEIMSLQAAKTGALIRYACRAGAILGHADDAQLAALTRYGETLGLLFQLADDLLDATGTQKDAGKAVAKDAARGKGTLVASLGVQATQYKMSDLCAEAEAQLAGFENADVLKALPDYLTRRVT